MKATMLAASLGALLTMTACGTPKVGTHVSVLADASTGARLNVPANSCEIYIEKIETAPNSHASGSIRAVVRVPWLGNGETVQTVGFFGSPQPKDLGNAATCHETPQYNDPTPKVYAPSAADGETVVGEYLFDFPIFTGTVEDQCPGFTYSWTGAFFVQTNLKTYWVNPAMDKNQSFDFDPNGWNNIEADRGTYQFLPTTSHGLGYYNPLACTR